jgi:hypothetical protein
MHNALRRMCWHTFFYFKNKKTTVTDNPDGVASFFRRQIGGAG